MPSPFNAISTPLNPLFAGDREKFPYTLLVYGWNQAREPPSFNNAIGNAPLSQ